VIINWTDPIVRATIGIMSASDAAPLPRLGEVFFDVRGNSRTMRLSWYADTGIAVFSIWQGGRCTGTFRLPMDDLARMTEILQRGPQRQRSGSRSDNEQGGYDPAGYDAGYEPAGHDKAGSDEDWYLEESSRAGQGPAEHERAAGYPDRAGANRPSGSHDSAGYERPAGYGDSAGYERPAGYGDSAGYEGPAGYGDSAGYERPAGYGDFQAEGGASDATGRYEFPARAVRPEDGSYLSAAPDHDGGAVTDLSGYGQQRFVPPYVRPGAESYLNDNPAAGPARRHGADGPAYPADQVASDGSDWPPADPGVTAEYSAGRHSGRRARSSSAPLYGEPELDATGEPISERDYWRRQAH
jgi:hypothetical protein